ncbi:MAG: head GIN domain-containing protein [Bacteroidota bacterium]
MKRTIQSTVILLALLFAGSFYSQEISAQEVRELEPFEEIGIAVRADVFYTQGNGHQIKIEGRSQDVEDLITEVENGLLRIRHENYRLRREKLTIYITSEELESVKISGSAKFMAENPVTSEEMELAVSGSGGVMFDRLSSEEVEAKISGSGSVELAGRAEEMETMISGSGKIMAEDFEVSECSAVISGSGSCTVAVKDELDAKISGSGNVYYKGDPEINSVSSGSGSVRSL